MLLDRNNTKIRFTCQQFECTEFRFIDKDRALVFDFRSRLKTEDVTCKYCGSSSVEVHDNKSETYRRIYSTRYTSHNHR